VSTTEWLAVGAAALPLAALIGVVLTWPLWRDRRGGPWFAPALLTLQTGIVVLGGVVATAAAGRTWQLLEEPDEQAAPALLEVSRMDGDSSLYAVVVLVLVAATALLGLLLSMTARFAASDHRVDRGIACVVIGLLIGVSGVGLAYLGGGSRSPVALLAAAQLPLLVAAMAACWPAAGGVPRREQRA
jgi:hypothetical protein